MIQIEDAFAQVNIDSLYKASDDNRAQATPAFRKQEQKLSLAAPSEYNGKKLQDVWIQKCETLQALLSQKTTDLTVAQTNKAQLE